MKRLLPALFLAALLLAVPTGAQEAKAPTADAPRFTTVDVLIDSKDKALAVYQFEFAAETGDVKIVGVEGGEHPAFQGAPYYDPEALDHGRIVIAAFNTGQDLPKGRTRVATLHLRIAGAAAPRYAVKLVVAADADGRQIPGEIHVIEGAQK
jgi:hypothetical protein